MRWHLCRGDARSIFRVVLLCSDMLGVHANSRLPSVRLVPPLKMVFSPPLGYMGVKANVTPKPRVKGNEQSPTSSVLSLVADPDPNARPVSPLVAPVSPAKAVSSMDPLSEEAEDYKDNGGAWATIPETDEFDVNAGFKPTTATLRTPGKRMSDLEKWKLGIPSSPALHTSPAKDNGFATFESLVCEPSPSRLDTLAEMPTRRAAQHMPEEDLQQGRRQPASEKSDRAKAAEVRCAPLDSCRDLRWPSKGC